LPALVHLSNKGLYADGVIVTDGIIPVGDTLFVKSIVCTFGKRAKRLRLPLINDRMCDLVYSHCRDF
jgi:hypothetical protein